MENSILTAVFLPLALAFIMLGMGLSLTIKDFKNIFVFPKAVFIGLLNQMILLPIIAFGLILLFDLRGTMAIGLMILACCPGGATSNLISHLSRGDVALSVTLTAITSFITILTIPLIINFSLIHFGEEGYVTLPVLETIVQIMGVTVVPISIGMLLNYKFPKLSLRSDKPVRIISAVFFALIVIAAILKERANLVDYFIQAGPVTLLLNLATLGLGYLIAKVFLLPKKQQLTIAIESGIQNGTLGIMIAATLLQNSAMTIPVAIYSLIMFVPAVLIIFYANRTSKHNAM
jgi:bile acid:Na+ symporter, BASS family